MEFKISKLKYSYTINGIANIAIANKEQEYFLDDKLTIPLVFCSGDKNVDYWRKKSNISESDLNRVFGNSESIEHYNKKMEIANNMYFVDRKLNIEYKAHSSKTEYYIKSINKIVDVAFFDKEGDLLICIEVFYTNKKNREDIIKFNKENIIVYEYDIQQGTSYPISAGIPEQGIRGRISRGREFIQGITIEQERFTRRVLYIEKAIKRRNKKRKKEWRDYYSFKGEIESKIKYFENRIKYFRTKIKSLDALEQTFLNLQGTTWDDIIDKSNNK